MQVIFIGYYKKKKIMGNLFFDFKTKTSLIENIVIKEWIYLKKIENLGIDSNEY